jgi:hypothetical protein
LGGISSHKCACQKLHPKEQLKAFSHADPVASPHLLQTPEADPALACMHEAKPPWSETQKIRDSIPIQILPIFFAEMQMTLNPNFSCSCQILNSLSKFCCQGWVGLEYRAVY